ncbi:MAG: 3-deoxy-manno-octulosonate cytidylyltransferase [Bacteroidales bacterium]|nr:3-deoxy-manno-octulosonate cytidylyltransferase [Bacteroidales bacterium]
MNLQFIGIIPARYDSTRFPGKPLVKIGEKSMVQRVYEQASRILDWVIVATDDVRIKKEVKYFEGNVIMTSPDHKSGTERCAEAYHKFIEKNDMEVDVVINIQSDEPFIQPKQIKTLMNSFYDPNAEIATLIKPIKNTEEIFDPNVVKVVVDRMGYALYFSRSPIPHIRNCEKEEWLSKHHFYKHIGIYAYKPKRLNEIIKAEPSLLEKAEMLEQNAWLDNGFSIKTSTTNIESISIDTPEDLEKIEKSGFIEEFDNQ